MLTEQRTTSKETWIKVLDQTKCIGCHACTTACKSENQVPLGVTRTYVKAVEVGTFPQVRRSFQVTRCNQCTNPPCVAACPTGAMYQRPDGIVDFNKAICIGCKACMAACPYDAIFINPEDHSAEKCNFCAHRLDIGLEPACVVVCPTEAILIGKLEDDTARATRVVHRTPVAVRNPEKGTRPKLFYRGAHQATLDPIAAERPRGDTYMWSQIPSGPHVIASGHPADAHVPNSSAKAKLVYDVAHNAPWGGLVSLYTWTKGLSAGAYLVPITLWLLGKLPFSSDLVRIWGPSISLAFLAITGGLLIGDLKHPERFYLLFLKGRPESWLVRGGYGLLLFGGIDTLTLIAGILHSSTAMGILAIPGIPLAALAALYTAFLFAQAKARDLWQSPLMPIHLVIQALLLGSAVSVFVAAITDPGSTVGYLERLTGALAILNALLVVGEITITHPTAKAHLAVWEMTHGALGRLFWLGFALDLVGILTPLGMALAAAALLCILPLEHAYVQAGQRVPLA
ncbi:4Fe-4S ferredoxin iron-sulfur binding domain protein [Acidimicrobium ferrooxidans DSM 10331]|uniref:4Fe-4S ferredoxin iron-sulfur binding domain protein n=1 Tax=Acidimicrobium ferrooxidans (strain DSM 10331 / JCM 15462 / NBRC 103882 / ICP) TaxID=525909 RepID=C7LZ01_ACIFD|nr:4Fe-4S dicluster domain-containing protein [Acidimicrobium ferrooxidans]ACU53959.1 4Fe-4S ferredoxin iron-sulfur binding domain protein [Acidimicrobium ferrooxidans DSM 10331]